MISRHHTCLAQPYVGEDGSFSARFGFTPYEKAQPRPQEDFKVRVYFKTGTWPLIFAGSFDVQHQREIDLGTLTKPEARAISGTILGPDGLPCANAVVNFLFCIGEDCSMQKDLRVETVTRDDGSFTVKNVPCQKGYLCITTDNLAYQYRAIESHDAGPLQIKLLKGGRIRGEIHGEISMPSSHFIVLVYSLDPVWNTHGFHHSIDTISVDESCRFLSKPLPPGRYRLKLWNASKAKTIETTVVDGKISDVKIHTGR
jgi:hypothetical protein